MRWALPGLVLSAPLDLLLGSASPHWPVWLLTAPVVGFVLHQSVRMWFEGKDNGFRSRHRGALAAIIERGGLAHRTDCGDLAYQAYEVVFYQRPDWQAAREHLHRCWDIIFLCWSMALAGAVGAALGVAALGQRPGRALLYVIALAAAALALRRKGQQTLAALHLFDRALVLAHWPLYDAVLRAICAGEGAGAIGGSTMETNATPNVDPHLFNQPETANRNR